MPESSVDPSALEAFLIAKGAISPDFNGQVTIVTKTNEGVESTVTVTI